MYSQHAPEELKQQTASDVNAQRHIAVDPMIPTVYVVPTAAERREIVTVTEQEREVLPTTCACVGFAFSWLPLIGCMNFLLNLGMWSCLVASIVMLYLIICLSTFTFRTI